MGAGGRPAQLGLAAWAKCGQQVQSSLCPERRGPWGPPQAASPFLFKETVLVGAKGQTPSTGVRAPHWLAAPTAEVGGRPATASGQGAEDKGRTILPQLGDELVGGLVEQRGDVVVQGVHVLHEPLVGLVVHLETEPVTAAQGQARPQPLPGQGEPTGKTWGQALTQCFCAQKGSGK